MLNNAQEAGIYLHIPFCRRACHYCNFHFSTSLRSKDVYLEALQKELLLRRDYLEGRPIRSIYFGGGTPSVLSAIEIQEILTAIHGLHQVGSDAEVTLEANPDDLNKTYLGDIKKAGINRLSIGIQSFFDRDLQWMNRTHTGDQARHVIRMAQEAGIHNISADLIYGIPGLSDAEWVINMQTLIDMQVPHISSYALTVEPKTALAHFILQGKTVTPDEQQASDQFRMLRDVLQKAGYQHYEISNFAKPEHMAVHNTAYWKGYHYLGVGAAAHSFNGVSRQWNVANNAQYIHEVSIEGDYFTVEELNIHQRMNEYIMTTLRTMWGLDLELFREKFGAGNLNILQCEIVELIARGQLEQHQHTLHITPAWVFLADSVIGDLFFVD